MAQGSEPEPGVMISDPARTSRVWVRLDGQGITYSNSGSTGQVGWDQVRCFTAGPPSRDSWALRIALHDGSVISPKATRRARSAVLAAIRQAAVRASCAECGADSTQTTPVCARCGAPLSPLTSP